MIVTTNKQILPCDLLLSSFPLVYILTAFSTIKIILSVDQQGFGKPKIEFYSIVHGDVTLNLPARPSKTSGNFRKPTPQRRFIYS